MSENTVPITSAPASTPVADCNAQKTKTAKSDYDKCNSGSSILSRFKFWGGKRKSRRRRRNNRKSRKSRRTGRR